MNRTTSCVCGCLAAGLLMLSGSPAWAQTALGDGTALDRNLQVGSGGKNTRVRDINQQIRFNNAIVTGNAAFGRSFRGDTPYSAAGDFRGSLGSNDLFQFRRDSAVSTVYGSGLRGTDALRYQFALSTGQALPSYLGAAPGVVERSGARDNRYRSGTGELSALRSTSEFISAQSLRPTVIGTLRSETGGEVVTASPLAGINFPVEQQTGEQDRSPGTGVGGVGSEPPGTTMRRPGLSGLEATSVSGRDFLSSVQMHAAPSNAIQSRNAGHDRVLNKYRAGFERDARAETEADAQEPTRAETKAELRDRSREVRWDEELQRIQELLRSQQEMRDSETGEGDIADDELISERALRAIRGAGERLETLVPEGKERTLFAENLKAGQELMEQGRYFDAEAAFARAIAADAGDPLGLIGRVHAQLGAGLYVSAALNLRRVYQRHPELAGMTYAPELAPSKPRIDAIERHLRDQMSMQDSGLGRDAPLLLGYLGHISGNDALRADGINEFANQVPFDNTGDRALAELLRGVWVVEDRGETDGADDSEDR